MLVGGSSVFTSTDPARKRVLAFALGCIALYFAAFAYLYLTLPVYSTGKATYTLGLAPAYALLGRCGMDFFGKRRLGRAISRAWFICWAVSAYAAYFVI